MKKSFCLLGISILILIFASSCFGPKLKYDAGRDTKKLFGDGSFQICGDMTTDSLMHGSGSCVIEQVDNYFVQNNKVYIIGHEDGWCMYDETEVVWRFDLYGVIDTENNTLQICAIETSQSGREFYIYPPLIENGDIVYLPSLSCFTEEDLTYLLELGQGDGLREPF